MDTVEELIQKLNEMVTDGVPNYNEFQVRALLLIATNLFILNQHVSIAAKQLEIIAANSARR